MFGLVGSDPTVSRLSDTLAADPRHPCTQGLMRSFPPLHGLLTRLTGIPGAPPDLAAPPSGCRFHPRCPHCVRDESARKLASLASLIRSTPNVLPTRLAAALAQSRLPSEGAP